MRRLMPSRSAERHQHDVELVELAVRRDIRKAETLGLEHRMTGLAIDETGLDEPARREIGHVDIGRQLGRQAVGEAVHLPDEVRQMQRDDSDAADLSHAARLQPRDTS